MKKYLILICILFLTLTIQSQEGDNIFENVKEEVKGNQLAEGAVEANKDALKASVALIDFYTKYDNEGISGEVNQDDFDTMLKEMNWTISARPRHEQGSDFGKFTRIAQASCWFVSAIHRLPSRVGNNRNTGTCG